MCVETVARGMHACLYRDSAHLNNSWGEEVDALGYHDPMLGGGVAVANTQEDHEAGNGRT